MICLAGCGKPPKKVAEPKPKAQAPELQELKGAVTGSGWHIPWTTRDPKNPKSKPIRVLIADAEEGAMKNDDGNLRVVLQNARVKMFRDGKPAASLDAAILSANRDERVVIGSGGVTLFSLQDPPDTVIKAQKMVWNTRGNTIVAVGNAHITHRLKNGTMTTSSGGRVTFDTKLEDITIE